MKLGRPRLVVVYSPEALDEIDEIAAWNQINYGDARAIQYIKFLTGHIDRLEANYPKGRKVDGRADLRYIQIRKRSKGHGHVALYTVDPGAVTIIHVFHTSQDWQSKILGDAD